MPNLETVLVGALVGLALWWGWAVLDRLAQIVALLAAIAVRLKGKE